MKLILGSKSPRRRQLLEEMGLKFEVRVKETDERYPSTYKLEEVSEHIAKVKAEVLLEDLKEDELILTADTIVCVDDLILGKPVDEHDAQRMFQLLSGRSHTVITSVCLANATFVRIESCKTEVVVKELSMEEINFYISNYKPFDKAGSYGIQEWFGAIAVGQITGSYNNVVGLPTHLVYKMLTENIDMLNLKL